MRLFAQVFSFTKFNAINEIIDWLTFLVMVMAACFAVMPVMNLNAKNPEDLYYSWKSFRNFYSIANMLLIFAFTIIVVMWSISTRLQFDNIGLLYF